RDGAPRRAGDHVRGVDDEVAPDDVDPEAVEAAGGGAAAVFVVDRVLRSVAGALEPLGGVAERDAAAEVDALAVQGDEATLRRVGGDVGGDLGRSRRLALADYQPEEDVHVEARAPAMVKLRPHGLGLCVGDLGSEAAAATRPAV